MDYKDKPASYYFTEVDLKKILLEVTSQPMVIMPLKRKQLIKELASNNEQVVGRFITQPQFEHLQKRKVKNTEPTYLNQNDIDLIEAYFAIYPHSKIKRMQQGIIKSFISGGFRVQELCDFDPSYIDRDANRIKILGKGKKWRWTHVEEDFITFLLGFQAKYGIGQAQQAKNSYGLDFLPFFTNSQGLPFTSRNIQKFMETISSSVHGLSHTLHPHLLRHTYGVFRVVNNPTFSIEELRQDMGHEDIRTTQIYFRLAEAERIKLAKRRADAKSEDKENKANKETSHKSEMYCKVCGKSIAPDSKFCRYCGGGQ